MADLHPIHIPPQGISPVDPVQGQKPASKPAEGTPGFQDILKQQLGELSRETEAVANVSNPTIEDVDKLMDAAKNLYEDTMNTHQLLQDMMNKIPTEISSNDNDAEK